MFATAASSRWRRARSLRSRANVCSRWLVLAAAVMVMLPGCRQRATESPRPTAEEAPEPTALLHRMRDGYRSAETYSDRGVLRLRYRQQGRWFQDNATFSVEAQRPNRLRVRAYRGTVVCDGKQLSARIVDDATANLDGQVLVRGAPAEMNLRELYRDPVLRDALVSGLGRQPLPLELLFAEQPMEAVFQSQLSRRLLPPAEFEGQRCYRVEAETAEGPFVFWIDEDEFVLRKLEYPVRSLLPELAQDAAAADAELVAEFSQARLGGPVPEDTFALPVPADAKQVRWFVLPPQPLPSALFGKQPGAFAFLDPRGGRLSGNSLLGKIAVLVWFHDHPVCRRSLEQLQQVAATYRDNPQVAFYAVCTEPSTRSNQQIAELLRGWGLSVPLLRDLDACGRDVFRISGAPALVIFDRHGRIQVFEIGANPQLTEQLPVVLGRLSAGHDLAAEIVAQHGREQAAYTRSLAAAQSSAASADARNAELAPRSDPQKLKLEPLWTVKELAKPGNILLLEDGVGLARVLVHDGPRTIVELDPQGKIVGRHELPLSAGGLDYLRTAVDASGQRYYAAAAIQGQRAVVFDQQWRLVLSYPPPDYQHGGIGDVQLADLDRDGQVDLLVGFNGVAGIHAVSLRGEKKWVNHGMAAVLSLVPTPVKDDAPIQLLATGPRGDVLRLDGSGKSETSLAVGERAVFHLFATRGAAPAATAFCGITFGETGNLVALGLSSDLKELWDYDLPAGIFRHPVQFVTSGPWLRESGTVWVLGAPDGTIHLVSGDGQFADHLALGQDLQGIAFSQRDRTALLLATAGDQLHAWRVTGN